VRLHRWVVGLLYLRYNYFSQHSILKHPTDRSNIIDHRCYIISQKALYVNWQKPKDSHEQTPILLTTHKRPTSLIPSNILLILRLDVIQAFPSPTTVSELCNWENRYLWALKSRVYCDTGIRNYGVPRTSHPVSLPLLYWTRKVKCSDPLTCELGKKGGRFYSQRQNTRETAFDFINMVRSWSSGLWHRVLCR
jgi:hypothetical protein